MVVLLQGLFTGLLATILIDAWALFLQSVFRLPTTDWAMVGRWVGHLRHGTYVHNPIATAAPVAGERAVGWATHYVIGLLYGVAYLWLVVEMLGQTPGLTSAIVFSLVLLVAPWFIMQPGLGLGVLAHRAPRPWLIRGINISVHIIFGVGLYLGWMLAR